MKPFCNPAGQLAYCLSLCSCVVTLTPVTACIECKETETMAIVFAATKANTAATFYCQGLEHGAMTID